jgi:ComF family protein
MLFEGSESSRKHHRLSNPVRRFLNSCSRVVRIAFPAHCVLCASRGVSNGLCGDCTASLPRVPDARCGVCAQPLTSGGVCAACLDTPPAYDAIRAPYAYAFPLDALIHAYKYGRDLSLAPVFATHLMAVAHASVDAIVPMPLSPERLRERGFNQAHELARRIGRELSCPVLPHACRKIVNTPPQATLPWAERARNIRRAFVCDEHFEGTRIAIVDDVMTTGATLNELARNIKRAGARYVEGWVLARTLK